MHIIATSIISWFRTIILDAQASHSGTDENAGVVHVSENGKCILRLGTDHNLGKRMGQRDLLLERIAAACRRSNHSVDRFAPSS